MKWRNHGANPEKLYKQFNIMPPEDILDFSTNTNVIATDIDPDFDINQILSNYPDDECIALRKTLAVQNGVDPNKILVTNGSNEAIYLLASIYNKIAILQPVYGEYERACKAYGKETANIFSIDELTGEEDLLFICNPNNPTGTYLDFSEIEATAFECAEKGIDVVFDEAYFDFVLRECENMDLIRHENIYILRSMTKIYHMAGARLGYVMAGADKIDRLKKMQPTWSVNAMAQAIGIHYLNDKGFLEKTKKYYKAETVRLTSEINQLGYEVLPTDVHYFLMKTKDDEKLIRFMLKKGIVLRHTRSYKGLDGNYVRICTREKESNNELIAALKEYKEYI